MTLTKAMLAVVAASALCVLVALVPYVVAFGAWRIDTERPEQWAHFGTYLSGALGPLLSILNLVAVVYIAVQLTQLQQADLASKRLSLDLYNDWHAEELHTSRIAVSKFLSERAEPPPTLSDVEGEDLEPHLFRLYHFFEKWALLCRERQADPKLLQTLLGGYASWWRDEYFGKISTREADEYMKPMLAVIHEHVFAHAPSQKPGQTNRAEAQP